VQSVDISEGCAASGINNALREIMTDLKNVSTGAVALETPAADQLNVDNIRIDGNTISSTDTNGNVTIDPAGTGNTVITSGNVGIGTSSISGGVQLHATGAVRLEGNFFGADGTAAGPSIRFWNAASGLYHPGSDALGFVASGSEKMRIDSSGNLLIGATAVSGPDGGNSLGLVLAGNGRFYTSTANGGNVFEFNVNGTGGVGSINVSTSGTSFNTSSDYRLKQGVEDMTGAIDRVKALAPKRFQFIADADRTVDGFLAHEAQAVVPEAVHGTHNEVDDDGNAVMQGIDQSKLVPLLTGALQEAIAKIETLETQRADLEARLTALENA